jgi:hypothetical protein
MGERPDGSNHQGVEISIPDKEMGAHGPQFPIRR